MKYATACPECRSSKRRCTQNPADPESACLACKRRNIQCSRPWRRPNAHPMELWKKAEACNVAPPADSEPWDYELRSVSSETICEFVHLYFRFIHDRPHSLFHEQSTLQQLQDSTLPGGLLAALCALGCRLSPHTDHRNLAHTFTSKAKSLLAQNLEDIAIPNVQSCILLANSYAAEQNNGLEALYFGIANRMAYVLSLHKQDPNDDPILRETKCRIWWSLFMADRWCPPGLGLPREIRSSHPSVDLPMDEIDFQSMRPRDGFSWQKRKSGLWAYKITLVDILASIQDMNLSLVQDRLDRSTIDNQVRCIEARLQGWHDSLPTYMVVNDQNIERYRGQGCAGTFAALHLGYHHYSTLLYFQFLEPDYDANHESAIYAAKCRLHGLAFSRLLHTARRLGDCHVVYLTVAHMTIVSSSVLLHLLLFGNDEEVETARLQLTRNFEALMDLSVYWPCVDKMKERLFIFQNACLLSASKTYAVDKWIVRFLLETALPFERKDASDDNHSTFGAKNNTFTSNVSLERRMILDKALEDLRN